MSEITSIDPAERIRLRAQNPKRELGRFLLRCFEGPVTNFDHSIADATGVTFLNWVKPRPYWLCEVIQFQSKDRPRIPCNDY